MNTSFSHGYALLIGVGECEYLPWSLPVTVKDMLALQATLLHPDMCGYIDDSQHLRLLHDAVATRQQILAGLTWLKEQTDADPDATAIVFYSGHGWVDHNTGKYYLVPHDVKPYDCAGSALDADTFSTYVQHISARRLLVLIDSCHAGGMTSAKETEAIKLPPSFVPGALTKDIARRLRCNSGRAVFSSSSGVQKSWIRPGGSLSIFTGHLLEALQGAGSRNNDTEVRVSDLMNYLARTVPESAMRMYGAEQIPFFDTATEDFPVALLRGGKATQSTGPSSMHTSTLPATKKYHIEISNASIIAIGDNARAVGSTADHDEGTDLERGTHE
jgi:hypothetical protein